MKINKADLKIKKPEIHVISFSASRKKDEVTK